MTVNRKAPQEKDILDRLSTGELTLRPLNFRMITREPKGGAIDMIIDVAWKDQSVMFAVECKAVSTPRMVRDAAAQAKAYAQRENYLPMVVVPFLDKERLDELEREEISGIDLCGNGTVIAPGKFAVYRTGAPNQFRNSAPIKNIYQRNSSIVGRVFLACPRYASVTEIQDEVRRRTSMWSPISLATVSKALQGLEEDLIVKRDSLAISLVQPDKLLEKLASSFTWKRDQTVIRAKVALEENALFDVLLKAADEERIPLVATGLASVSQYAVMQRGPFLSVYCPNPEALLKQIGGTSTERFPNIEIIEADESFLYFDAREQGGFRWASPIQVYLELMSGDKRDRETAEQVRGLILDTVRKQLE
ncbi:MAG TPA: hypothetical protein VF020_13285 [Chthoniobacterales bacterium]